MEWTRKDLLSLYDLSAEEITFLLDTAEEFKKVSERNVKKVPALRGKTVVNLFVEPSTRTRVSFELAEQRLSADIVNMQASSSSLLKGETLLDTVRNIESLQVDLIVMRHSAPGAQAFIAKHLKCGVVNAGDGAHSHPTQALLDIFTMREKKCPQGPEGHHRRRHPAQPRRPQQHVGASETRRQSDPCRSLHAGAARI